MIPRTTDDEIERADAELSGRYSWWGGVVMPPLLLLLFDGRHLCPLCCCASSTRTSNTRGRSSLPAARTPRCHSTRPLYRRQRFTEEVARKGRGGSRPVCSAIGHCYFLMDYFEVGTALLVGRDGKHITQRTA